MKRIPSQAQITQESTPVLVLEQCGRQVEPWQQGWVSKLKRNSVDAALNLHCSDLQCGSGSWVLTEVWIRILRPHRSVDQDPASSLKCGSGSCVLTEVWIRILSPH
ncbi:unnamed protein product [Pleuronectes platessa]|uniref:Uncharacterized protein n=1 Tax=Pleuronectes platessa TaxID=8262 RepID=A0A9N7Z980_PLEPL|nr:unnamed protein product [Pleuronectes platessa]